MTWVKLKEGIEMWDKPCLGKIDAKSGERFMALCVDPASKKGKYRGIARVVYKREGTPDKPGWIDHSKLAVVESKDLLGWEVKEDLKIKGFKELEEKLEARGRRFIGVEDPDIIVGENGEKNVYYTIAFKHTDAWEFDVFVGHARGKTLNKVVEEMPVLSPIEGIIGGFKELCPSPLRFNGVKMHLAECLVHDKEFFSGIALIKAKKTGGKWEYSHLALDPKEHPNTWFSGHVSPCRILPRESVDPGKGLYVLIFNGRSKTKLIDGEKVYSDFLPGVALYNARTGKIEKISNQPLLKDPVSTGITFASEFVPFDKHHGILYCHPNDSFVRAYKINYDVLKV